MEVGDEQESEESGEEEGEEEGTESDLVRTTIFTQPNHFISHHVLSLKMAPFVKFPLYLSASEHRVKSEEEVEKEDEGRQRVAQAVQETEEEDKGQR